METSLPFTAWALIGAASLAPIGAVFGGIAGALARKAGRAPGGKYGRTVARAVTRLRDRKLSAMWIGAIVGGVDGALFLAVVGAVVGLFAGYSGVAPGFTVLLYAVGAIALLAATAVVLGAFAHGFIWAGTRGIAVLFLMTAGGVAGTALRIDYGLWIGILAGAAVGLLCVLIEWSLSAGSAEAAPEHEPDAEENAAEWDDEPDSRGTE